jgi:crotonobetainyl-CoA:carnitine CoA-transferase CaiB-like acyl-CoA transferase
MLPPVRSRRRRHLFIACGNPIFWNKFALGIDRPDLVVDPRFEGFASPARSDRQNP